MFFDIFFWCLGTGLCIYCVLKRLNRHTVDSAVHSAVHEIKKELQERNATMVAQLAAKERELAKARELVQLHEAVPTRTTAAGAKAPVRATAKETAKEKAKREGLEVFAMSRPFTDTSYDALLATSDVVKVEPASM